MSVAEIKEAVKELSPAEVTELTTYLYKMDNDGWDRQMEADATAGKLDFLIEEAERARREGTLRDWPKAS